MQDLVHKPKLLRLPDAGGRGPHGPIRACHSVLQKRTQQQLFVSSSEKPGPVGRRDYFACSQLLHEHPHSPAAGQERGDHPRLNRARQCTGLQLRATITFTSTQLLNIR